MNKSIEIPLNKALWLLSLMVYGVFSWGPKPNFSEPILSKLNVYSYIFLTTQILMIVILTINLKQKTTQIRIQYSDLVITLFLSTSFILTKPFLWNLRLSGDEIFHSQSAGIPGRVLAEEIIAHSPDKMSNFLESIQFRFIVSFSQLIIIVLILILFVAVLKSKSVLVGIGLFLTCSILCYSFIGYGYKYPSGYIAPQFLISGIVVETIAIRFAQITVLIFAIVLSTRNLRAKIGMYRYCALLAIFFQIPVISFNIGQIDQAIYFAFTAGIILYYAVRTRKNNDSSLEVISTLLCILVLCRSSTLLLVPLVLLPLIVIKRKILDWKSLLPIASLAPILFVSFVELLSGVLLNSTKTEISAYANGINPIFALWQSVFTQFDLISLLILFIAISYLLFDRETRMLTTIYFIGFSTVFSYGIPVTVRGLNKYALEVFLPLIFFAALVLSRKYYFIEAIRRVKTSFYVILAISFIFLSSLFSFQGLDNNLEKWGQVRPLINYPLQVNIEEKLTELKLDQQCKNLGATYGYFNFVLNGVSYERLSVIEDTQLPEVNSWDWGIGLIKDLNLSQYSCLVLDAYPAKEEMRSLLRAQGFTLTYQEVGRYFPTVSEIWEKSR